MRIQTLCYLTLNTIEGTTADKQDVTGIDSNILLIRMLTTTLRRNVHTCTFQKFQQSLLYALTTDITCNGGVVRLAGNLINLVNKHNTTLRSFHIIVSHLQQARQNTLYVLAHITSFREHRCINDGKRYVQQFGNGTCQQRLTRTRRTHHNDVRLLNLYTIIVSRLLQTLVMIIYCYRQESLSLILTNDILVQIRFDFLGLGNRFLAIFDSLLSVKLKI